MAFPFFAKATKQFSTDQPDDLELYPDDIVQVTRLVNENWYHGQLRDQKGIFPVKYVVPLAIPPCSKPHGVGLYDHQACLDDELSFHAGDLIELTKKINAEWYIGKVGSDEGMFPTSFISVVKEVPPPPNPKSPPRPSEDKLRTLSIKSNNNRSSKQNKPKHTHSSDENDVFHTPVGSPVKTTIPPQALAANKFTAQLEEEIDMMLGDTVYLLEHVDECFIKVRIEDRVGIVPTSFLNIVEPLPNLPKPTVNKRDNKGGIVSPTYTEIVTALADDFTSMFREPIKSEKTDDDDEFMKLMPSVHPPAPPRSPKKTKPSRPSASPCPDSSSDSEPRQKPLRPESIALNDSDLSSQDGGQQVPSPRQPKRPPALDRSMIATLRRNTADSITQEAAVVNTYSVNQNTIKRHSPLRPRKSYTSPSRPGAKSYNNNLHASDADSDSSAVRSLGLSPQPPPVDLATLPSDGSPCNLDQVSNLEQRELTPIHHPDFHNYTDKVEYCNDGDIAVMRDVIEQSAVYTEVNVSRESSPQPPNEDTADSGSPAVDALTLAEYKRLQKKIEATEKLVQVEVTAKNEVESDLGKQFSGKKVDQEAVMLLQMLIGAHKNKITDLTTSLDAMRATIRTMGVPDTSAKLSDVQKRDKVAEELLSTETEHVKQLELCITGFVTHLKQWKDHSMDTETIFMNMEEILSVSRKLLMMLEGQSTLMPHEQMLGRCFTHLTKEIHEAYTPYLQNHTYAAALLAEYSENKKNVALLNKCLQHIRDETTCWDLQSFLIRPVQRIMRYPLLLKELLALSPSHWPDRAHLSDAISLIDRIVRDANEAKRKTELLKRYSQEASDTSILPKISIHGLRKKSRRFTTALTQSLKITNSVVEDDEFDLIAEQFLTLSQVVKNLLRETNNFTDLLNKVQNEMESMCNSIHSFYNDLETQKDVFMYHAAAMKIADTYTPRFINDLNQGPVNSLQNLQNLFAGPQFYIDKRAAKLLDYDNLANNKTELLDKNSFVHEHVKIAKGTFEALNKQLIEDLPQFNREGACIVRKSCYSVLVLLSHYSQSCYNELKTTLVKMSSALNDVPTSLAEYHKERMRVCCAQLLTISSFHPDVTSAIVLGGALPKPVLARPQSQFFDDTNTMPAPKERAKKKTKKRSSFARMKSKSKIDTPSECSREEERREEEEVEEKVGSWLQAQNDYQYSSSDMSDSGMVEELVEVLHGTECTVLYHFTSAGEFMLTVDEGDNVQVLTSCTAEQAWCYVGSREERGYVPKSYLTVNRKRRAPPAPSRSLETSPQSLAPSLQGLKSDEQSPATKRRGKKPAPLRSAQSFKRQAPAPPVKRQTSAMPLTTNHKEPAPKPTPQEPAKEASPEPIPQEPTQESPQFLFKETMSFQDLRESDTTTPSSQWESSPAPSSSATYDSVPPPYSATYEPQHVLPTVETVERAPSPVPRPSSPILSPQPALVVAVPTIIPKRCAPPPPSTRTADVTVPKSAPVLAPYKKTPAPRKPSSAEPPKAAPAAPASSPKAAAPKAAAPKAAAPKAAAPKAALSKKASTPFFDECPQEFSAYSNSKPDQPSNCPTPRKVGRSHSEMKVEVLYDYTKTSQEELSVSRGLVISLLEKDDPDWWFVRDGPAREGYVPANYLKLL